MEKYNGNLRYATMVTLTPLMVAIFADFSVNQNAKSARWGYARNVYLVTNSRVTVNVS